ncbi:fibronectin type III domain-containing protein [Levilactobacillus zymae]|uniref:fibronectin type III domain-containing protein n=1 Tax=Levilactobacillus zymae TaxID=267363 RepID=UPI003FCCE15B
MATPNVGILTTTGKALIDKVNSGQAKISFSKVVFSSMDNSQLSDTQIKALTAITPQEVVVSSPQTTLDTNSGETRIRATGTNEKLADGVYVKTYGVFAKDDTGNEILYGVTVSPNPNYFPAYDGVTPQAVTYSYKTVIQETSNITMTNSNDVYVSQEDLTEAIAAIPKPDLSSKVNVTDTVNWQKYKLTGDDGSAKFAIASGEDVDTKLKAIIGTKDTGKLLVDIDAKNNPTGHSLIGEYFCDFDGLVTGYGIGPDGAMWSFAYNGTTTIWKWILTAKTPGIPKLAVKYNATSKAFDYTLTAPEKDGFSDIIQYNLLWKDHSVDDWKTVIVKPDSLTGQLTVSDIAKTYDFKVAAQNAVGSSDFTDVITLPAALVPGIPSLIAKYNAGKKGFDYTVTAPESDGGSEITGYSLEYQKQGSTDWTKVALNPDSLTGTVTDGIEAGSNYLFRVNAENAVGSSDYFTVSGPFPTVDGNIYGVSWDGSSSGALQRTEAAVGLKAGINGAQNDFDTRGPWGLMDKTVTDSYGNAFVRVPKFYIRKTQNKPLSTWQVSLVKQGDDWYLPNCFYDFDNKKELDYVDVSRYEGSIASGKLQSKTGATPTANQTIVKLRSSAVANNTDGKKGYHLWDVHTLDALQVLFTIEFATLDSQSIMKGNTDNTGTSLANNGATDNVKGSSGFVTSGATPMTYRGIENLYGNLAMWTDGLNINNLSLYSCDDATKYASDVFASPYYKLNYSLHSGNSNIISLGFDKDHPSVEAPTSFNNDQYNTYYHDWGYVNGSGNYVVYTGGSWDWWAGGSGLWCWCSDASSAYAHSNLGSRLIKKAL